LVDEPAFDEPSVNKKSVDKKSVDKKSVDKKSVDKKSVDKKSVDKKSVNEKSVNEKSVDEPPLYLIYVTWRHVHLFGVIYVTWRHVYLCRKCRNLVLRVTWQLAFNLVPIPLKSNLPETRQHMPSLTFALTHFWMVPDEYVEVGIGVDKVL
jgi:hypothetical protein